MVLLLLSLHKSDGGYHLSDDPADHILIHGYKESKGECHWGAHIYRDGSWKLDADAKRRGGKGRKSLGDLQLKFVWMETNVRDLVFSPWISI
jgi:hypothetical protein